MMLDRTALHFTVQRHACAVLRLAVLHCAARATPHCGMRTWATLRH